MNRIYKIIYSEARNSYMVVSELACRHGRSTRSGRAKAAMAAAVLTALVSFSWTGMTAEAAVQSEPLVVTEKDKVIDDDFQVINHTHPTAIYVDPSSTGTVQVNSDTISVENKGKLENRIGIIHTGSGWNGTLNLKEGMKIRGNFTGPDVDASGVELDGYDLLTDDKNTGKPYDGKAYLGNDISIQMNADKATDNASFFGMQSDGEYLQAGDGLSIDMSAHTGNWAEVHGIQICHYGTMNIGDNLSIRVENQLDADTKHNLSDGIITYYNYVEESQNVHAKGRQALSIGRNAHINTEVRNDRNDADSSYAGEVMGIRLSHTDFTMGDGAVLDTKGAAHLIGTYGINVNQHTVAKIGNDLSNTVTVNGNEKFVTGARVRNQGFFEDADKDIKSSLSIGDRGKTVVSYTGSADKNYNATNGLVDDGSDLYIGHDHKVKVIVQNNGTNEGEAQGLTVSQNGRMEAKSHFTSILETHDVRYSRGLLSASGIITLGDCARNEVNAYGQSENAIGYYINGKVDGAEEELSLGNDSATSVKFAGDYQGNSQILSDLWNYGADTEVKDHASFTVSGNLTKAVPQAITQIRGIYVGNGTGAFGDNLTVHTLGHNYAMVSGIVASADVEKTTNLSVGDNAHVTVDATEDETGTTNQLADKGGNYIAGIKNSGTDSSVTVGRNAQIQVSAPEDKDASALWVYKNAEMKLGDGAVLTVNSAAAENNNVVKADSAGKVTFDGGMTLSGSQNAIYSTGEDSSVIATGEGRKVILGNLESAKGGAIKLNLNTNDSLLRGKSTVDDFKSNGEATHGLIAVATAAEQTGSSRTELALANGALWDMTSSSQVTKLDHRNGGIVNMAYNKEYQTLKIGNFSGQDGTFRMKTDLDSQTDGDKVYMTSAEAGSKGLVQVHDESFLKGKEVTGTKHLLLITDDSKNATFSGLTLDDGGLWDVTPTIQRGNTVKDAQGNIVGKDTEWYLTKLEKKVNKDTIPLMKAADNSYALYRLDIDSLRKRMGDLRFRNMKDDSGIWARDFHGAYEGQGTDSRYNGFQLGYDYAANEKSLYGFFAERTISNPKYSYGSSKDHGLSGGLYGTWFGDSGVYTDVVAKWGRNDTELHTRGGWPDSANYRTRSESLSVELGKTFTKDDGLFLEPEAQMVFGRLGSKDYTTSRGRTVHMGSYDSAIGRLGILLGKRVTEGDHPYDYYLKFSLLHEFGGERNFHLAAPDGETMDYSEDYRDTWQEAGLGGTWHINGNTSIYADAERSFGGDWHKKWQWNLGINWQF